MNAQIESGIVTIESRHSVDESVTRLVEILKRKDVKVFAIVDHSGEAEIAGLRMLNTKLIIFGNPRTGTPLMIASPSIAIDLPLKILVREDGEGKVWVSYNDAEFLGKRHQLAHELIQPISAVGDLARNIAG